MISMSSAPTLAHQTQLKLSSKDRATFPTWRPKRTVFCRQKSGLKTCSRTSAGMDIQRFRCKRTWYYSWVRDRRHGRRGASMVSSCMWEADWSKPNVLNEGLGESQMFRIGPLPGDIAEVEAFCRIFRVAEQLHTSIMNIFCNPVTGECTVTYLSDLDNFLLEEKVVAGLACMSNLIQRGRQEVLSGRPSSTSSPHSTDWNVVDDKLPPLASFRAEMKKMLFNVADCP